MRKTTFRLITFFAIIVCLSFVSLIKVKHFDSYYFAFRGTPGTESEPSNWDFIGFVISESPCNGLNQESCIIKVDPDVIYQTEASDYEISLYLLWEKYSITSLPVQPGIGISQIPNPYTYPTLFLAVTNTSSSY
ncbi:MAG: hypothetical protein QM731_10815 [Chitinophagaceae bacterium]